MSKGIVILLGVLIIVYGVINLNSQVSKGIDYNDMWLIKSKVKNINAGGCGYFALKLYEQLDSLLYSIVLINDGNHVVIRDNKTGFFIDANGYKDSLYYQLRYPNKFSEISYDSLSRMVDNKKMWNPTFDWRDTSVIINYINTLK